MRSRTKREGEEDREGGRGGKEEDEGDKEGKEKEKRNY